MLVLWGGTDINPAIYGAKRHRLTQQSDTMRDIEEEELIDAAIEKKEPIIGICRGAQFVCAKAGGTLWQHSTGHGGAHTITVIDFETGPKTYTDIHNVAAGHHQIMNPGDTNCKVYGASLVPTRVWDSSDNSHELFVQPEVVFFPDINALAIQPHPEWMNKNHPFNEYLKKLIKHLFNLDVTPHDMEIIKCNQD